MRDDDLLAAPDTRDDELEVTHANDVAERLSINARVDHIETRHKSVI